MESEPNRPSDLMRAGFITDTIASCDGPVNEHQIVVCERQETLNVIDGLIQQKLREDTDLLYRFRRIEIGPPPNEDPSLAAFWKSIIEAQIEAGADADAQNAITRWEEDGESNPQQYSLLQSAATTAAGSDRRTVVIVKNADIWLDGITRREQEFALRWTLQNEKAFLFVWLTARWPVNKAGSPLFQSMRLRMFT